MARVAADEHECDSRLSRVFALLGKRWEDVTESDYLNLLHKLEFTPRIETLATVAAT